MMNATVFSFTRNGALISVKLQQYLESFGFTTKILTTKRYAELDPALQEIAPGLQEACKDAFATDRLLVFLGATGIAIRAIAPYIRSLATGIAEFLGAVPVITTATDINKLFAVDEWATRHNMSIFNLTGAKLFASYLVDAKVVGVKSDFPVKEPLPTGMVMADDGPVGVAISLQKSVQPFVETVVLRPRILHLGIGCRRGTPMETIEDLVIQELNRLKLSFTVVRSVASIDVKKDEQGLLRFAKEYSLPIHFYSAEKLLQVKGDFTPSAFVAKTVGVDNVCERAAVLDSDEGKLLLRKTSKNGVTLAIAAENFVVDFNS